jgi:hypothetical protein
LPLVSFFLFPPFFIPSLSLCLLAFSIPLIWVYVRYYVVFNNQNVITYMGNFKKRWECSFFVQVICLTHAWHLSCFCSRNRGLMFT